MKVYILTDLEGATGVVDYDYGDVGRRRRDREFLVKDVNAAVSGAYDAGARTVVVYDGHRNAVLLDKIDPRATLIKGDRPESYLPGLDSNFTHLLFVGAHSMAGAGGVLSHTNSLRIRQMILNGQEIGEIGLSLIYADYYGIKPAFISGDDKAIEEAKLYTNEIEGAIVKETVSERCGKCLPPAVTYQLIYEGVKRALSNQKAFSVELLPPPYELKVVYKKPWIALPKYLLSRYDGVRLLNLYTIMYKGTDFVQLMRKFIVSYTPK